MEKDRHQIKNLFVEILKKYAKDPSLFENLNDNTEIIKDLKINSARIVDITLDIEEALDIELDDNDMDALFTIGESIDTIEKLVKAKT
ncbi:MAG: acyl carrier protein [Bacteroidota bacterium]